MKNDSNMVSERNGESIEVEINIHRVGPIVTKVASEMSEVSSELCENELCPKSKFSRAIQAKTIRQ